jgi:ribosomal protein S21
MGIRVVVGDGEPLGKALRRLKRLVAQDRGWQPDYYVPRPEIRRAKVYRKAVLSRRQTALAKFMGLQ